MTANMQKGEIGRGFKFGIGFLLAGIILGGVLRRDNGESAQQALHRTRTRRLRGGVTLRAAGFRARLSAAPMRQDVTKNPGETLNVDVEWSNQTTDFRGDPIRWPFRVLAQVGGQGRTFQGGAQDSQFVEAGATVTTRLSVNIPSDAPAGTYTVTVALVADDSDDQGNPGTGIVQVDSVTAPDRMVIPQQSGPAQPGGSIGSITLSQRLGINRRRTGLLGGLA
jgi:hypothetical protein